MLVLLLLLLLQLLLLQLLLLVLQLQLLLLQLLKLMGSIIHVSSLPAPSRQHRRAALEKGTCWTR